MHRFWKGFFYGVLLGGIAVWLWEKFIVSPPPTVPTHRHLVEEKAPDDLTAIRGIGPTYADRLFQAGIHTFSELAHMTPTSVAECCQISAQRIRREGWIEQAAAQTE